MKISVLMPVYNQWKYLPYALDSLLRQEGIDDLEIILIDDASDKQTKAVIRKYVSRFSNIKLHTNPKNIGLTKSLNIALSMATGDIFARQDSDDISMPTRFQDQLEMLRKNNVELVTTWSKPIDTGGDVIKKSILQKVPFEYRCRYGANKAKEILLKGKQNSVMDPTMVFTRALFDKIGYFDEECVVAQGYNYILRAIEVADMEVVRKVLYLRRKHAEQVKDRMKAQGIKVDPEFCQNRAKSHLKIEG